MWGIDHDHFVRHVFQERSGQEILQGDAKEGAKGETGKKQKVRQENRVGQLTLEAPLRVAGANEPRLYAQQPHPPARGRSIASPGRMLTL